MIETYHRIELVDLWCKCGHPLIVHLVPEREERRHGGEERRVCFSLGCACEGFTESEQQGIP